MCGTYNSQISHSLKPNNHGATAIDPYPSTQHADCVGTVFHGTACYIKLKTFPLVPQTPSVGIPFVACVYNGWISPAAAATTMAPTTPTLPSALNPSTTAPASGANATDPGIEDDAAAAAAADAAHHASGGAAVIGGAAGGGAVLVVLLILGVYYKRKGKVAVALAARKQAGDSGGMYTNVIYQERDGDDGAEDEDDALLDLNRSDDADDDALITMEAAQC